MFTACDAAKANTCTAKVKDAAGADVDAWCVRATSGTAKTAADYCAAKTLCGTTAATALVGGSDNISYLCTLDAATALPKVPIVGI